MWTKTRQFTAGWFAAVVLLGLVATAATAQDAKQPEIDFGQARMPWRYAGVAPNIESLGYSTTARSGQLSSASVTMR